MAAYFVSGLQRGSRERVEQLLRSTGFFDGVREDPFDRAEWLDALAHAPSIKESFHTVLTGRHDLAERFERFAEDEALVRGCFV
jgi:glycerol-1-phosphate dehydrogenase [NAD(P)+]